jgi:phage-related protein
MGFSLADAFVYIRGDRKEFDRTVDGVENTLRRKSGVWGGITDNIASTAGKGFAGLTTIVGTGLVAATGLAAAGFAAMATGIVSALGAGSQVEEMMGKFETVFGDFAGETIGRLDEFAAAAGRNKFALRGYAASLQDTFVPLGFARDRAAEMSATLVELAVDLASFNNVAEADVARDLQAAMVGNTQVLLKYGVVANQATIQQKALEMGLWDGTGAMDAQARAMAILQLTLEGTEDAQGDAIRTSGSWANTIRGLTSTISEWWQELGVKLLPIFTPLLARIRDFTGDVLPALTTFIMAYVIPALEQFSHFLQVLMTGLEGGVEPLKALENALIAAFGPEVAGQVLGFVDSLIELKDRIVDFLQPVWDAIAGFFDWKDVMLGLGVVVAGIIIPLIVSLISTMLPIILVAAAIMLAVRVLRVAWENDWGGIQGKTQAAIAFITNLIQTALARIQAWWAENGEQVIATVNRLWNRVQEAFGQATAFVTNLIQTTLERLRQFWDTHGDTIMTLVRNALEFIQNTFDNVLEMIAGIMDAWRAAREGDWTAFGEALRRIVDAMWEQIKNVFTTAKDNLTAVLRAITSGLQTDWNSINWGDLGRSVIDGVVNGLAEGAQRITDTLMGAAQGAWDAWQGFWGSSSPSKRMMGAASDLYTGFEIESARNQSVTRALADQFNEAESLLDRFSESMAEKMAMVQQRSVSNEFNLHMNAQYALADGSRLQDDLELWRLKGRL